MNFPFSKSALKCILSLSLATLVLVGCSDQVLNPDGSISTRGNGQTTQDPSQTEFSTLGDTPGPGHLTLGTEAVTGGTSLEIGGNDPETMFKDAPHVMHAEFLRTGESDSILLRMDDTVVLVDTADSDDYSALKAKLSGYGITTIDHLIITHFDNDHIGSAAGVIKDFNVTHIYAPDYVRDSGLYRNMMSAIEEKGEGTTLHRVTEDVEIHLDYGRLWLNPTHLYPSGEVLGHDSPDAAVEENNFSLITSVYFGETSMLLLGDAEADRMAEFNALFAEGEYPAYTLVKTPHHGSYDKHLGASLSAVRPRYCVVCTDIEDKVEAGLVTSMRASGAAAYYTYNGEITFSTDGSATKRLLTQK